MSFLWGPKLLRDNITLAWASWTKERLIWVFFSKMPNLLDIRSRWFGPFGHGHGLLGLGKCFWTTPPPCIALRINTWRRALQWLMFLKNAPCIMWMTNALKCALQWQMFFNNVYYGLGVKKKPLRTWMEQQWSCNLCLRTMFNHLLIIFCSLVVAFDFKVLLIMLIFGAIA